MSMCPNVLILLTAVGVLLCYHGFFTPGLEIFASQSPMTIQAFGVPSYAIDYAPLIWLDVNEKYFPSDMYAQVANTNPMVNFTVVDATQSPLNLDNLNVLNLFGNDGKDVFLTSILDVDTNPEWLNGVVPDASGKTNDATSCAIIVNDHGSGMVDVFYMYFYAYNQGNTVLFHELGDHVGDWEHNMIRFRDGVPQQVWYSQHGNGEAFTYKAVEKEGKRPIGYSARGSHATYATAGTHDHTIPDLNLPRGLIQDYTSKGKIWDPAKSAYWYTFEAETSSFHNVDSKSPLGAMYFKGQWGDEQYAGSDPRQDDFLGFYKYVSGPTGPQDKQLNRTKVCPDNGILCIIRDSLGP
ncbi:hypothetical protein OIDMADRAFT_151604 [Oidiodendron maius Zn]|uniref:Vacuolar protein sorting-associated protein 62 n=1 Tax=Oidiodendron maius (strain Zn) TaxID=913774 RepID=A0A0C3E0D9_OIDMZ|nr:hypothetical protein OIDMADRAFT_151604 [Oidiodendron maius Zn]